MNGSYFFTGFGCFRFISTLFYIYVYTLYSFGRCSLAYYSVYTKQPPGICSSDPNNFLLRYLLNFGNRTHHIRKI